MKQEIEVECECCGGTGLYSGLAERDGCAVICNACDGKGKRILKYNTFTERKKKNGVKRVFESSFGYVHAENDVTTDEGVTIRFSQGGCTYEEWLNGKKPKPVKDLYCPYIYRNKGMGNEPLKKCIEGMKHIGGNGAIKDCKFFKDKANCWEEFEKK